ncbi:MULTISPECIES: hypothetical protein [Streptococcus]|jgi:hypothetical protein|nr:hypothetical protein [Streptococcus sp. SN3]MDN5012223.1 hypothetical protein [Streptococcus sp. SN3]
MIDEQLQDSLMPTTVLLNNFVTNENKSNYEFFIGVSQSISFLSRKIKTP